MIILPRKEIAYPGNGRKYNSGKNAKEGNCEKEKGLLQYRTGTERTGKISP